jgi:myo-inositol 2-dehydrogenase/D-chiro-inositol 1-dehydrogenase
MTHDLPFTRRGFLKSAAATGAVLAASGAMNAYAAGSDEIRVGVIGCGGRGKGACANVLESAKGVKMVAAGDVFEEKIVGPHNGEKPSSTGKKPGKRSGGLRDYLTQLAEGGKVKELGNSVDLPDERCFSGLDAYDKVINCPDVNYVMLATPPGFRPLHIQATIAAGKNLFTEKPVGVDGTGIRKVLAAYEEAQKKGLKIVAGTQRRHQLGYVETMKRVHDGAIGDITSLRAYWNGGGIWFNERKPGMSDVAYQLNNWYHFLWLCGDHIVEQHVHNLDVINWAMNGHPEYCDGAGGRTPGNTAANRREGPPEVVGQIYDNFSIDYVYPNGVHMYSSCRHLPCTGNVSEAIVGTKGVCLPNEYRINGAKIVTRAGDKASTDPYVQEHTDLIECIRSDKPINELKQVAESTLTAIMGRMAAYTGKQVKWEQALNTKEDTFPTNLTWDMSLPVGPVPHPGQTKLV